MVCLEVDSRVKESNYNYLHGLMGGFRIYFERLESGSQAFFAGTFWRSAKQRKNRILYGLRENIRCPRIGIVKAVYFTPFATLIQQPKAQQIFY